MAFATTILAPILKVIDKVIPDKDKKEELRAALLAQALEADSEFNKAAASIIVAEAQGESWLQRNWRPITMLSFLGLIYAYFLGMAPEYVTENPEIVTSIFDLFKIGIGGYIVGRSGEKVAKTYFGK